MKIFECKVCGHIEFNEAPETCLICHSKREAFQENPEAIKQPADPANLTDGDKKHIPKLVVVKDCGLIPEQACTDVHVRVGEILHPMLPQHFIRYIDYYLNHAFISRVWLSPETCHAAACLHVNATEGTITVVENCSVHGNWMAEASI